MTLDTTYQLIHTQNVNGQKTKNVYFYDHIGGAGGATELCLGFQGSTLDLLHAMQTVNVVNESIFAANLGITTDFNLLPDVSPGELSGQMLSPQDAYTYTFKSADRAIRPGGKRYVGVSEDSQSAGTIFESSTLAAMEFLRLQLNQNIVIGADIFQPVLVKRIKIAVTGTVPLQYTYRLPRPGDPFLSTTIPSVLTKLTVSSQVSRKIK